MQLFLQQTVNGLGQGAIIVIFAVGFSLIFSHLGILNVAHGAFATWGAIIGYYTYTNVVGSIWIAAVVAIVSTGLIGVLVDLICFAPLRDRTTGLFGPLITSIGAWIVLLSVAQIVIGINANGFPPGVAPIGVIEVAGIDIPTMVAINIGIAIIVPLAVWALLNKTRFGASIRAIGHDRRTIAIAGVNTRVVILWTAFLAAAISGLAGLLGGLTNNVITYNSGEALLVVGFAAVVLGGVGSIGGAVFGGFAFGLVQVYSAQYVSSSFRDAITYSVLLIILLARPQGIRGKSELVRA